MASDGPQLLSVQTFQTTQAAGDAHKFPEDFAIFNEVAAFVQLCDWSDAGNRTQRLWASAAWLKHTSQTLEEFTAYDYAGNSSEYIKGKSFELSIEVQVERRPQQFEWVIQPNNRKPRRVLHAMYPGSILRKLRCEVCN